MQEIRIWSLPKFSNLGPARPLRGGRSPLKTMFFAWFSNGIYDLSNNLVTCFRRCEIAGAAIYKPCDRQGRDLHSVPQNTAKQVESIKLNNFHIFYKCWSNKFQNKSRTKIALSSPLWGWPIEETYLVRFVIICLFICYDLSQFCTILY